MTIKWESLCEKEQYFEVLTISKRKTKSSFFLNEFFVITITSATTSRAL